MDIYQALGNNIDKALQHMVDVGNNIALGADGNVAAEGTKSTKPGEMMGELMKASAIVNNENFAAGTTRQHNQKIGQSQ